MTRNEAKKGKRNETKEAKRNETKEAKRKNKAKISEKNILKRNEGKTASMYFCFELKRKIRKRNEAKQIIQKRNEAERKIRKRKEKFAKRTETKSLCDFFFLRSKTKNWSESWKKKQQLMHNFRLNMRNESEMIPVSL
jgi:hypothetical protein